MSTPVSTKGDRVEMITADLVNRAKSAVERLVRHPDEAAVLVAPSLLLAVATHRHRLTWTEQLIISEAAIWLGTLAAEKYTAWKAQPTTPAPLKVA
jgi:hypothetical protein